MPPYGSANDGILYKKKQKRSDSGSDKNPALFVAFVTVMMNPIRAISVPSLFSNFQIEVTFDQDKIGEDASIEKISNLLFIGFVLTGALIDGIRAFFSFR